MSRTYRVLRGNRAAPETWQYLKPIQPALENPTSIQWQIGHPKPEVPHPSLVVPEWIRDEREAGAWPKANKANAEEPAGIHGGMSQRWDRAQAWIEPINPARRPASRKCQSSTPSRNRERASVGGEVVVRLRAFDAAAEIFLSAMH